MNRIVIVLALVIAVPLLGIFSSGYAKRGFEREFHHDMEQAAITQTKAATLLERVSRFPNTALTSRPTITQRFTLTMLSHAVPTGAPTGCAPAAGWRYCWASA